MTRSAETRSMALFCDFENIALGVHDANYSKFDIGKVTERLLLKGNIVVKKAYCDWSRYKDFKAGMHEASFEMIEIPHLRQSGKNSADIRMVVDALDLCYTKAHVDTFVIISGDSDFSPLVSKLRENDKVVIGVGVKNSTSDLLIANCDEFVFYDDLVRRQPLRTRAPRSAAPPARRAPARSAESTPEASTESATAQTPAPSEGGADKQHEAFDLLLETYDALVAERGEEEKIWGSMIKQTLRRRRPGFNESYYGFRTFGELLEEAKTRGIVELEHDDKSGGYIIKRIKAP